MRLPRWKSATEGQDSMADIEVWTVAHCTVEEQVLGVWRFSASEEPVAYYPATFEGRLYREVGEAHVGSLRGYAASTESIVDRLIHSMNPESLWFVVLNPDNQSPAQVFADNGGVEYG